MKSILPITLLTFVLLTGCTAVRDFLYNPVVGVNTETGVPSTNSWDLKPGFSKGIRLAGDVAPVPWVGLVVDGVMGILGIGGFLFGRQYRKAAISTIETTDILRQGYRQLDGGKEFDDMAVEQMKSKQAADGVGGIISKLVKLFTGKTKV